MFISLRRKPTSHCLIAMETPRLVFKASAKLSWVPDEVESKSTIAPRTSHVHQRGVSSCRATPSRPRFPAAIGPTLGRGSQPYLLVKLVAWEGKSRNSSLSTAGVWIAAKTSLGPVSRCRSALWEAADWVQAMSGHRQDDLQTSDPATPLSYSIRLDDVIFPAQFR